MDSSLEDHDVLSRDENNVDWKLMCPKGECFAEPVASFPLSVERQTRTAADVGAGGCAAAHG